MDKVLETIAERWDEHAEQYDAHHNAKNTADDLVTWRKYLSTHVGDKEQRVLDVGAGTGFLTVLLAELGYRVTALDISAGMLDIAKQRSAEKGLSIQFVQSPVETLPFADSSFDVLTNKSFLWTLLTPVEIAQEWRRVLKPGGKVLSYITIGKGDGKMMGSHYSEEIENMLPLKGASADKMKQVLIDAGFCDVEAVYLDELPCNHETEDHNEDIRKWYLIRGCKAL